MSTHSDLVERSLLAVVTGDVAALQRLVTPDFVWHLPGKSPIAGDVHGAEAWSAKLRSLLDTGLRPELLAMLEADDHVAVLQRNTARTGEHSLDVHVVNLFTVREGRLARLDTFFSDQYAVDAFWTQTMSPATRQVVGGLASRP